MLARPGRFVTILALIGSVLASSSACGQDDSESTSESAAQATGAKLYGADGNMSNSLGESLKNYPGALGGMKGTTPLTLLSEDFKNRLTGVNKDLRIFNYTGEAYDAVAIAAIAAEYSRTTDPTVVSKQLVGVTTGGTVCESISACLALARQGKDLQYRGVALRYSGLTDRGEPSSAAYAAMSFTEDNQIDESRTEFVQAGDERGQSKDSPAAPARAAKSGAPLKVGGLLPQTGRLATFGPPMLAAARLAINEINQAGGVLGAEVQWVDGDDGSSDQVALETVDRLVGQGVHVIIGAGASGVTRAVIPKVVSAGRILISPCSTSDELNTIDDSGLFFRTAPPDTLQGKALADIIMRDGPARIAIVSLDDTYGAGLAAGVQANLVKAGIKAKDIMQTKYKAKESYSASQDGSAIFDPISREIKQFTPDAILLVGTDESALMIRSLLDNKVDISTR